MEPLIKINNLTFGYDKNYFYITYTLPVIKMISSELPGKTEVENRHF